MISRERVEELVRGFVQGTDLFLVAVKVSNANKITVLADSFNGLTIDDCVKIHQYLEANLDRSVEDYEMEVSSPGLESPFRVQEQYEKHEGKRVIVLAKDGTRYEGVLKNVTVGGFDLDVEHKVRGKGKEIEENSFNFDEIKSVKIDITI